MRSKPTPEARVAMRRVLLMCMKISDTTNADCFFSYSPHVESYTVHLFRKGWKNGDDGSYVDMLSDITTENIERTLAKLNQIYKELKEEDNV